MSSWKKPTQEQIKLVLANLKGNLIQQFFAKLENPEWFEILKEQNLLWYSINTNDYGQEYKEWIVNIFKERHIEREKNQQECTIRKGKSSANSVELILQ